MLMDLDENSKRNQIIMLLKRNNQQSVAQLSKQMGITPMAVRQHLMSLENRGFISYKPKKSGIGRPVFLYSLTDKARDIFPKSYVSFIKEMLSIVEDEGGRKDVEKIFMQMKDRALNLKYRHLMEKKDLKEKVNALVSVLDAEGLMVELDEKKDTFNIMQFNCLLYGIAGEYPEACEYELKMYQDLLGKDIKRTVCQADGDSACVYIVPKA